MHVFFATSLTKGLLDVKKTGSIKINPVQMSTFSWNICDKVQGPEEVGLLEYGWQGNNMGVIIYILI